MRSGSNSTIWIVFSILVPLLTATGLMGCALLGYIMGNVYPIFGSALEKLAQPESEIRQSLCLYHAFIFGIVGAIGGFFLGVFISMVSALYEWSH